MAFIYQDNPDRSRAPSTVPYERWDANKHYAEHYHNLMYLGFIAKNTDNFAEKRQAEHEMTIAERKLTFWKRHPNYDQITVTRMVEQIKRDWSGK